MAKTEIDDLAIVLSASTDQLAGDLRAAAKLLDNFKRVVDKSGGTDVGEAKTAAKEAEGHKKAAKEASGAWKAAAGSLGLVKAGAIGMAAAGGWAAIKLGIGGIGDAFQHAKDAVNMASELELTTIAFEVMLKSGEKAVEMLADIRKFASETPFNNAELTDASRKLIAYGLAGEQVIPTLRMLGDVSAATQTPISDLAYLYGTLAAQQRAYSRDIFQFANRGIPIYEELAKVLGKSVAEVKDLVEEGKVGFPEVVKAFKAMTEGKGRYAGLTARQADTFAGVREQLADAIQVGKIKFGKVLIEELGLKEGMKDLTKFVENLEQHLDRIRPGVRLIGDLGRSFAQVAYELGKGAVNGGDFLLQLDRAARPELYKFFHEVGEFLKSGKDFKLNPKAVNEAIFWVYDGLMELFVETLRGIKSVGEALRNDFIKPLGEGMDVMLRNWYSAKQTLGLATPGERFRPPATFERDEEIVKRFRELWNAQVALRREIDNPGEFEPIETRARKRIAYGDIDIARQKFLAEFAEPELTAQHKLFVEGQLPEMKGRRDVVLGNNGWLSETIKEMEARRAAARAVRDQVQAAIHEDEWRKKNEDDAKLQARQAADAFAGLVGGAGLAAKELSLIKAPPGVDVPWAIPADVLDAAKHAKEHHGDPLKKFEDAYSVLTGALAAELLDIETYQRARDALVKETAGKLGLPQTQLPEAAVYGSEQAQRLINQFKAGGPTTSEDLLREIRDLIKARGIDATDFERRFLNTPSRINPFGPAGW